MANPTASDLDILRKYDTPTVCNVIELFGVRSQTAGYMDKRIQACYKDLPPAVGYAATATFRSSAPPRKGGDYGSMDEQIAAFSDLPGPPIVVFQDLDDSPVAATFGEVMCTSYKTFGAQALITSGAGRDYEQVKALGFPCFCDGYIASHGYPHFIDIHVPIHVGGLVVNAGDLIHADANGVTNIPVEIGAEVAQACEELVAAEDIVLDYLKAGSVSVEGFADARKQLGARIGELKKKYGRSSD